MTRRGTACRSTISRYHLQSPAISPHLPPPPYLYASDRLTWHRVQTKWAGHIKYAGSAAEIRLRLGTC